MEKRFKLTEEEQGKFEDIYNELQEIFQANLPFFQEFQNERRFGIRSRQIMAMAAYLVLNEPSVKVSEIG